LTYVRRKLSTTFQLGEGNFGENLGNAVKLEGLRTSARIIKAGGPSMGTAQLQIYGMTLDKMNQFSTLGLRPTTVRKNVITVEAGDVDAAQSAVFIGNITNAWFDGAAAPDTSFQVLAHVGGSTPSTRTSRLSYKGTADVATILSGLATQMGKSFENNGVDVKLSNPYFTGSARDQALACVKAAGIQWNGLDDNKLAIWPSGQSRNGTIPLVSKETGMELYPTFTSQGIMVRLAVQSCHWLRIQDQVESILKPANGEWVVYALSYELDGEFPQGRWHMTIQAARPGYAVVA
jgi:hypothetical protein